MRKYIAYFDFLGYKEFILNNTTEHTRTRVGHILRDIEGSLSSELTLSERHSLIADLEQATIHCLNISDTVIFYSNDDSLDSFEEIIKVAFRFNWMNNRYNFPVRGIVALEDFDIISNTYTNPQQISYRPNIMYGKGLVLTHLKCDNQVWAGCCVDSAVIQSVIGTDKEQVLYECAIEYIIPLKNNSFGIFSNYALRLYTGGANETTLGNITKSIKERFASDNKPVDDVSVKEKIENTIKFADFLKDK